MRAIRLTSTLLFVLSLAPFATARDSKDSPETQVLSACKKDQPCIVYRLPKNYFRFTFKVKTETTTQGQFCNEAPFFFVLTKNPECKPLTEKGALPKTVKATLDPDVHVDELGEPDSQKEYGVNVEKGLFKESNVTLKFGAGGALTSFNSTVTDHKVDFAVGVLKVAASIVGRVFGFDNLSLTRPSGAAPPDGKVKEDPCRAQLDEEEAQLLDRLGSENRKVACTTLEQHVELRVSYLHLSPGLKIAAAKFSNQHPRPEDWPRFFAAAALVQELLSLQGNNDAFLTPTELPRSADAFSTLAGARKERAKEIIAQFAGVKETDTTTVAVVWRNLSRTREQLLTIDPKSGPCFDEPADDVWMPRTTDLDKCTSKELVHVFAERFAGAVSASSATTQNTGQPRVANTPSSAGDRCHAISTSPEPSTAHKEGPSGAALAYNLPKSTTLHVYACQPDGNGGAIDYDLFRDAFDIAQFGDVAFLRSSLGNSTSYEVSLNPITGALDSITLGGKPVFSSDLTDKLSGLADATLTAAETKIKADKPPTELDNATKQRKLAQEQLRNQMISKCLDNPELSFCQDVAKIQ